MTPTWSWADVDWSASPLPPKPPQPRARSRKPPIPLTPSAPAALPRRRGRPPKPTTPPPAPPMARARPQPAPVEPFPTAAAAVFWLCLRPEQQSGNRPCRPEVLARVLDRLYRVRRLTAEHLRVLDVWGGRGHVPSVVRGVERGLWDDAMAALDRPLHVMGVVG